MEGKILQRSERRMQKVVNGGMNRNWLAQLDGQGMWFHIKSSQVQSFLEWDNVGFGLFSSFY